MLVSYFLLLSSLSSSFCAPLCARGFVHVPRGTKASVPKFAFVVVMGTSSVDSTVRGEEEEDKERVVGCDTKRIEADEEEESKAPKLVEHFSRARKALQSIDIEKYFETNPPHVPGSPPRGRGENEYCDRASRVERED